MLNGLRGLTVSPLMQNHEEMGGRREQ